MGLLVLERRAGESVVLGDRITVTVDRIAGEKVTLAISRGDAAAYQHTLTGPDAQYVIGPVVIQARRPHPGRPSVKLSFAAPRHLAIVRSELLAAA